MFRESLIFVLGKDRGYIWRNLFSKAKLSFLIKLVDTPLEAFRGTWGGGSWIPKHIFKNLDLEKRKRKIKLYVYFGFKFFFYFCRLYFSFERGGSLLQNSYKPSWDWKATLLRKTQSVQRLAVCADRQTNTQTNNFFDYQYLKFQLIG